MDFIQLFQFWYNKDSDKAEDIPGFNFNFRKEGNATVNACQDDKNRALQQVIEYLCKRATRENFYNTD
jgi:hypothetical protein